MKKTQIFFVVLVGQIISCMAQDSNYNACNASERLESHLVKIIDSTSLYLKNQKEGCVFRLIDTLRYRCINVGYDDYFDALGNIYSKSDGEVSEYIDEIAVDLFYSGFNALANYIYQNKDSNIEYMIIRGMSSELSTAQNRYKLRADIRNYILKKSILLGYDKQKTQFLLRLEQKMDPTKFD